MNIQRSKLPRGRGSYKEKKKKKERERYVGDTQQKAKQKHLKLSLSISTIDHRKQNKRRFCGMDGTIVHLSGFHKIKIIGNF